MLSRSLADVARGNRLWDACIIGSGPAGITVARSLSARGWHVPLLEAGQDQVEPELQADQQGLVMSDLPLDPQWSRLRCLGGSSHHWGGFCKALDPMDFEPKVPGLPTDWPIGAADLAPWASEAIHSVTATDPQGARFDVHARQVVLCGGGIENARLLLWGHASAGCDPQSGHAEYLPATGAPQLRRNAADCPPTGVRRA